jgi:hypothetical protein
MKVPAAHSLQDSTKPFAKQPWCDHTKPIDARVADAVSRLTVAEKICSLDTAGCANPSLGLPSLEEPEIHRVDPESGSTLRLL